jgi:hypothetical protein
LPHDPSDPRGDLLDAAIDSSDFISLNDDSHTRLPFCNTPGSSPDVSLAPVYLLSSLSCTVYTKLNSDHLSILISLRSDVPPHTNFCLTGKALSVKAKPFSPNYLLLNPVLETKRSLETSYSVLLNTTFPRDVAKTLSRGYQALPNFSFPTVTISGYATLLNLTFLY